jgi:hypothetical protein
MGIDCSNCRCTNQDEEKILVIDNSNAFKNEKRKEKLDYLEKYQSSHNVSVVKSGANISSSFVIKVDKSQITLGTFSKQRTFIETCESPVHYQET